MTEMKKLKTLRKAARLKLLKLVYSLWTPNSHLNTDCFVTVILKTIFFIKIKKDVILTYSVQQYCMERSFVFFFGGPLPSTVHSLLLSAPSASWVLRALWKHTAQFGSAPTLLHTLELGCVCVHRFIQSSFCWLPLRTLDQELSLSLCAGCAQWARS